MRSIEEIHNFLKSSSPEELIKKYKILCRESKNNTYITLNDNIQYDINLKDKKLFCVPISIKDNICIKNMRTTCASKMLSNFIPNYTATVVKKLLAEGAIILGKVNMDEFAMGSSTTTGYFGPVINPISKDKKLIAGGSSGGSAASVAEGSAIVSLGSDTGGSVRHPAALCNVVGIKPTYGRCSRYGLIAFSSSLDQIGPIANNVKDVARILDVISGPDINDPTTSYIQYEKDLEKQCEIPINGRTVAIIKDLYSDNLSDDAKDALNKAIEYLKNAGCIIKEFSVPEIMEYSVQCYHIQTMTEAASNLSRYDGIRYGYQSKADNIDDLYKKTRTEGFGPEVKNRIITGNYILSREHFATLYKKSQNIISNIKQKLQDIFQQVDVILTPVVLRKAFEIDNMPDSVQLYEEDIFTSFVNLAGLCAISLPIGKLSVQIVANSFKEEDLISFASELERRNKNINREYTDKKQNRIVIGLEIHVQLNTKEKLFSRANTTFTNEANVNVSNFDIAIPGTLPILNRECLFKAVQVGLALKSNINLESIFDRKHYFYPDLPAGYQITQYYNPIIKNGYVQLMSGEKIRIDRAHLEQDAGKMIHGDKVLLDYNRAGIPLLEIVTKPDLSPDNVVEFMKTLRNLLVYLNVSDGSLEEGSFRADVNISIRNQDGSLGTRVEIKNINSYKFAKQAIDYEIKRQEDLLNKGEQIIQETRLFDEYVTKPMRSKEEASDYKYFPDPDISIAKISMQEYKDIKDNMPILPYDQYMKYIKMNISKENALIISSDREISEYFDSIIENDIDAVLVSNWIVSEWMGQRKKYKDQYIKSEILYQLIKYISEGTISQLNAKKVMMQLWEGIDLEQAVEGKLQINCEETIMSFIKQLDKNKIEEYKSGNIKLLKYLMGQVMQMSHGRANPIIVERLLSTYCSI